MEKSKQPITVEVFTMDPDTGKTLNEINQTFTNLKQFNKFYLENKQRDGIVNIMVRNYDKSKMKSESKQLDYILINSINQPFYRKWRKDEN